MFQSIIFYVGKKSVTIYEKEFALGEIAAQVLNISPDDYHSMKSVLTAAKQAVHSYEQTEDISFWAQANEHYKALDAMLCRWPVLGHLKANQHLFDNTKELLDDIILTGNRDFLLDDEDSDLGSLFTRDDIDEWQIRRSLLISPGNLNVKWITYLNHVKPYADILADIASFNTTIRWFISYFLSNLDKLNPGNYARALYSFFNHPGADKMIANPIRGSGNYTLADAVLLRYVPMPVSPDSDEYQIVEYYEADSLQSLQRCLRRIDQDVSRGIITDEERQKLRAKAKELFHQARIRSGTTNEEFETMLRSENLYPACNVIRKTRPRGRPKKEE